MNKEELIGQIIDIFEDNLQERADKIKGTGIAEIQMHFDDEYSSGTFYSNDDYDNVAAKIEQTLKNWGLING